MSGLSSGNKSPEIQGNAASFGPSQSQISSSQGGPWVPGEAVQTTSADGGNATFSGGPRVVLSSVSSVSAGGQAIPSFPRVIAEVPKADVSFMPWPMPGDRSINARLTGIVPNQSREMSSGVITQGSVANVSSSQSPGVGGQVGGAPMQMPMTQSCPTQTWHLCQIISLRELRLDNQKQVYLRVGSQSCQMYGSQGGPLVLYCLAFIGLSYPVLYRQVVEVE